jgi:hypothetical protein
MLSSAVPILHISDLDLNQNVQNEQANFLRDGAEK